MKKIFFLYNIKERELQIINYIEKYIYNNYCNCVIKKGQFYSSIADVIKFNPDIIVSIPLKDDYSANYMTTLKLLTNATIISMITEGYFPDDEEKINKMVGYNRYSCKLVDRYIVWGTKTKKEHGDILLRTQRLSSLSRIKVTGYGFYETQLVQESYSKTEKIEKIRKQHKKYKRNILVLTGFAYASDTIETLFLMSFFDKNKLEDLSKEDLEQGKLLIETTKNYRKKYIDKIVRCAEQNNEIGFIVKLHPAEMAHRENYYNCLEEYENITLIKEAIPIGYIFPMVDVMIHCNSTSNFESYIYKVPTILLMDEQWTLNNRYYDVLKEESTISLNINTDNTEFEDTIKEISFARLPKTEAKLFDFFNWKSDKEYKPSEWNAKAIMECKNKQYLNIFDKKVRKAVLSDQGKDVLYKALELCVEHPNLYLKTFLLFIYRQLCYLFR